MSDAPRTMPLPPGRARTYALLVGAVVVLLLGGLAVPYVLGDPVPTSQATVTATGPVGGEREDGATSTGAPGAGPDGSTVPEGSADGSASGAGGGGGAPGGDGAPGAQPGAVPAGVPGGGGSGAPAGPTGPATGEPVRVGFALVDLGAAREAGFVLSFPSPAVQQGWWQASVDEANDNGGINGRPIEPVYRNVNVLDASDAQQACVRFTEDDEVFAVVGVLYFAVADECVVNAHRTPLVTLGPNDDSTYASGLLTTLMPRTSRVIANFAGELANLGLVKGKHVGILGDAGSDPRGTSMSQLKQLVERAGASQVRTSTLGTDLASAAAQTSVVVNNWRSAGVDTVLFIVNPQYAISFVQNADRQFWTPEYHASDFANFGNSDIATAGMSQGFDGALSITTTTVNRPHNQAMATCIALLERRGAALESPEQAGAAGQQCDMFNVFLAGARAAGAELTAATLSRGMQSAGQIPATRIGGGSFGPGKQDLADLVGSARWAYGCGCWKPEGDFRRGGS